MPLRYSLSIFLAGIAAIAFGLLASDSAPLFAVSQIGVIAGIALVAFMQAAKADADEA